MGLGELKPFDPKEKVIEFKIEAATAKSLVKMNLRQFCNETLSDSPAPGGGSVAALMGALGASLGGMVANLSAAKRGWDDQLNYFSEWAVKGQQLKDELLLLVDEDTAAFNKVLSAFGLPKESAEEKAARSQAIQKANQYAAEIPLKVMETASRSYDLLAEMATKGNPASISDVGVGLLATRACIEGAAMNVRINLSGLKDEETKALLHDPGIHRPTSCPHRARCADRRGDGDDPDRHQERDDQAVYQTLFDGRGSAQCDKGCLARARCTGRHEGDRSPGVALDVGADHARHHV